MGRRNKAYFKDLHQQAYDRLTGMQAFGESKKEAVANGTAKDKIFSFNTYKVQFTRNYTQTTKRGLLTTNKG
jgi:hypothetical protein